MKRTVALLLALGLVAACGPFTPVSTERVFPTDDPDIEMVIGEYHEDGGDGPFGALGRNFKFSIATRNTVTGETTTWIDDEKGSVYGLFYSSSAGYLVFEWDSRRDGSSE